ncbi:hypothetical protein PENTCL1PPCAC_5744, partial [Pristionchus entomophagus]
AQISFLNYFNNRRSSSSSKDSEMGPILELPDDILIIIFENLSTIERVPLGSVSKKFRRIDFEMGKRSFDKLQVEMTDDSNKIEAYTTSSGYYSLEITPDGRFGNFIPKFFKDATASGFFLQVGKNREGPSAESVSLLFHSLSCETLYINFDSSTDFSHFLLRFFTNERKSDLKTLYLHWESLKSQDSNRLLVAFLQLPNLEFLGLMNPDEIEEPIEVVKDDDPLSFGLNGSMMLHVVSTALDCYLSSIHCTGEELLCAFEIVCESNLDSKKAKLEVLDSAADDLFDLAHAKEKFQIVGRILFDYTRGYALAALDNTKDATGRCTCVTMFKIDANGDPVDL